MAENIMAENIMAENIMTENITTEDEIKLPSIKHNKFSSMIFNTYLEKKYALNKKFIFASTTGRSGTTTLTNILASCENVSAFHEPYPIMNGRALKEYNNNNKNRAENMFNYIKVPNILRSIASSDTYFESNHMFIKSYIEFAYNYFGEKMSVIHLRRNPLEVADSIISIQNEPGTVSGNHWWLGYKWNGNLIKIDEFLDSYTGIEASFLKALWYWFEIEARINYWQIKLPDLKVKKIETNQLNNLQTVTELLDELNVPYKYEKIEQVVGKKYNLKQHEKTLRNVPRDLANSLHNELISELHKKNLYNHFIPD